MYRSLVSPYIAQIEITDRCPNKCVHCYNYWRHGARSPDSGSDISINCADLIMKELERNKIFCVVITGGEPLMNKKVMYRMLDLVEKSNLITANINTSLIGLTEEDAVKLCTYKKLTGVLTSLASHDQETHDRIVGYKGAFKKTVSGIRLLVKAGVQTSINMVVSKLNHKHVNQTGKLAKELGVKVFNVTRAVRPMNCPDFSQYALSPEEIKKSISDLSEVKSQYQISIGSLGVCPLCAVEDADKHAVIAGKRCSAGVTAIAISSDGNVRTCTHVDLSYGNLLTDSLKVIWEKMADWRNGSLIPARCKKCKALPFCGGGCRAEAMISNGSYASEDTLMAFDNVENAIELTIKPIIKSDNPLPRRVKVNTESRWREEEFGSSVFIRNHYVGMLDKYVTEFLFNEVKDEIETDIIVSKFGLDIARELLERKIVNLTIK